MGSWYFEKKPHRGYEGDWRGGPSRYLEVAVVVGARIRRLRMDRDWTLVDLAREVPKPGGMRYSPSHFSRLERGWASATLHVYLQIASVLDVDPWALFAPDEARHDPSPGELVLLRFLRRAGIAPDEALALIASREAPRAR